MYVGQLVDERNNPFKATHGAAQLFIANHKDLGSWPLAVTAYNHGRGGMSKATRQLGTSQLGSIINNYKSPSFGFASKNFYAEFLAAARTYDLVTRTGLVNTNKKQPNVEVLTLPRPMSVREIAKLTKLPPDTLGKLNPCLTNSAINSRSDIPLPKSYELRLPKHEGQIMRRTFASNVNTRPAQRATRR